MMGGVTNNGEGLGSTVGPQNKSWCWCYVWVLCLLECYVWVRRWSCYVWPPLKNLFVSSDCEGLVGGGKTASFACSGKPYKPHKTAAFAVWSVQGKLDPDINLFPTNTPPSDNTVVAEVYFAKL